MILLQLMSLRLVSSNMCIIAISQRHRDCLIISTDLVTLEASTESLSVSFFYKATQAS